MPKFLGRFSNSGLTTFLDSTTFDLSGAAATLLLPFLAPLTGFLTPGLAGCKNDKKHLLLLLLRFIIFV